MRATRIATFATIAAVVPITAAAAPAAGTAARQKATAHRCGAADLSAKLVPTGGSGAGTLEIGVVLRNTSTSACSMFGFPGLGLLDSLERPMRGFAAFDHTRTPHHVTLAPGARASFLIRYSDVPTGSETRCPRSSYLLVTPPNRRVSLELRARIAPCNRGRMLVTPVRAGGL